MVVGGTHAKALGEMWVGTHAGRQDRAIG